MAIRVPRGLVKDVPFNTLTAPGGSLTDQYNWTDGLTHAQWPTVRFYTQPGGAGTEITDDVAYDITAETIASATHKDPTGTTGVWRKNTGQYRIRVQPQNSLSFAMYYMRVVHYPTDGNAYAEDHEFEVITPGDTTFTDLVFGSITPDIIQGLIQTALTDDELQPLIDEAVEAAKGFLQDECGVNPDDLEALPSSVRVALISYTLGLVQVYDSSASGLDTATEVREGSEVIKFGNRITKENYESEFEKWMGRYCKGVRRGRGPILKVIVSDVGHSVN